MLMDVNCQKKNKQIVSLRWSSTERAYVMVVPIDKQQLLQLIIIL